MKIDYLKNLLTEFEKDVGFNIDLKKRIGLILEENQKFIIKQTLKELVSFLKSEIIKKKYLRLVRDLILWLLIILMMEL